MKKEFHSALANPLPGGGFAPVDPQELLSLASQAMATITARGTGKKAWNFSTVMRHPKMNEGAQWLLDAIYFTASGTYSVGPHRETITMICGADIHAAGHNDHRTLFYTAFEDSLLWAHIDAEGLVSVTMNNIDGIVGQTFGQPTWYMVEGQWRFNVPFSQKVLHGP